MAAVAQSHGLPTLRCDTCSNTITLYCHMCPQTVQLKAAGWWGRGTGNKAKRAGDVCYAHGWGQDDVDKSKDYFSEQVCNGCRRELGLPPMTTWWTAQAAQPEQAAQPAVLRPIPRRDLESRLEAMELRISQLEEHATHAQRFFDQTLRSAPE